MYRRPVRIYNREWRWWKWQVSRSYPFPTYKRWEHLNILSRLPGTTTATYQRRGATTATQVLFFLLVFLLSFLLIFLLILIHWLGPPSTLTSFTPLPLPPFSTSSSTDQHRLRPLCELHPCQVLLISIGPGRCVLQFSFKHRATFAAKGSKAKTKMLSWYLLVNTNI